MSSALFLPISLPHGVLAFAGVAAVLSCTSTPVVDAQNVYPLPYQAPSPYLVQPLSNADLLAQEVRTLAANPLDVAALVRAGELALKLGDTTAAAAFFVRASRIDPRNPRIKAGEGSLLVVAERPGEALRRFAEADALGGDARGYAADRGLAYDLIGEPERAQRDYRLALRGGANDETQRRYALSLGISGKRDLALQQLEPLLRKSDRGAWRARAFILAMGGDRGGAERIATSMMPTGLAQGLQPFFAILPNLPAADRAFAVHFGEVRATPERQFDRRLVPPLAALGPDPTAPVAVAAVVRPAAPLAREDRQSRRRRGRDRVAIAALTTPPPQPLPQPPAYRPGAVPAAATTPALARALPPRPAPVQLAAAATQQPVRSATVGSAIVPTPSLVPQAVARDVPPRPAPVQLASATAQIPVRPATVASGIVPTPGLVPQAVAPRTPLVIPNPSPPTMRPAIIRADPIPPLVVAAVTPPLDVAQAGTAAPAPAVVAQIVQGPRAPVTGPAVPGVPQGPAIIVARAVPPPAAAPVPVRSEDSILSSILADLIVPASELDAEPVRAATEPVRVIAPKPVSPDPAIAEKAAEKAAADKKLADKAVADKKLVDKKAADKKLADKKAADKKLADAKAAAEEKRRNDPKLLEPSRIWVQVAGGASEGDLTKAWAAARAKAPAAFKGRGGWTTPLRATNRVLAGPFKSSEDAQSFVNSVAKDGISGFVFTSTAGQKIEKLPAK